MQNERRATDQSDKLGYKFVTSNVRYENVSLLCVSTSNQAHHSEKSKISKETLH